MRIKLHLQFAMHFGCRDFCPPSSGKLQEQASYNAACAFHRVCRLGTMASAWLPWLLLLVGGSLTFVGNWRTTSRPTICRTTQRASGLQLSPPSVPADVRWDLWPALPIAPSLQSDKRGRKVEVLSLCSRPSISLSVQHSLLNERSHLVSSLNSATAHQPCNKAPYERRRTFLVEYIPGELWGLEQKLGLLYVHVPIRMTVLRLESGGLLIYGAVAPTDECLSLVRELESKYGAVRFLVLPTVAVEHKTFAGPLAQRLPDAEAEFLH